MQQCELTARSSPSPNSRGLAGSLLLVHRDRTCERLLGCLHQDCCRPCLLLYRPRGGPPPVEVPAPQGLFATPPTLTLTKCIKSATHHNYNPTPLWRHLHNWWRRRVNFYFWVGMVFTLVGAIFSPNPTLDISKYFECDQVRLAPTQLLNPYPSRTKLILPECKRNLKLGVSVSMT